MRIKNIFNNKLILSIKIILPLLLCLNVSSLTAQTDSTDDIDLIIGQMLIIGFRGCGISENSRILDDIKNHNIGGVVLYDYDVALKKKNRNIKDPEQLKNLINILKSNSKIPLFIAIDQEGGRVNRLKEEYGFPPAFSAHFLGELGDIQRIKTEGSTIGKTLFNLGININFAPVVDLNVNPDNPAIGKIERSFTFDPYKMTDYAEAFIEGLQENHIISCIKHFPGHGSSYNDSHKGMTDVTSTWNEAELIPYENIIKNNNCDMIMTAHIFNGNLDYEYPATLSKKIITGILREKYGYNGVIITDDMQMKAIRKHFGMKKAIYLSIEAGADIILFANNLKYDPDIAKKFVKTVKQLLKEKKISKERLLESYIRITQLKKILHTDD